MELKDRIIIELTWMDAQSFDLEPAIVSPEEVKDIIGLQCSIVGYLIEENKDGYVIAKERWENNKYKYLHFIPKKSVLIKNYLCQKKNQK